MFYFNPYRSTRTIKWYLVPFIRLAKVEASAKKAQLLLILIALIILTGAFFAGSFFVDPAHVLAFRWMTMGMATVAFIFYLVIRNASKKENKKMLGSYIGAVVLKFMLSILVVVLYGIFFNLDNKIDIVFFLIAYLIYSVVTYTGAYMYKGYE